MYSFLVTGMSMLQALVGLADSDDELQVLQLLIRTDMLQGIKRLLQAQLAGQLGLDIQCNDGQPVVLQGDQRPEEYFSKMERRMSERWKVMDSQSFSELFHLTSRGFSISIRQTR